MLYASTYILLFGFFWLLFMGLSVLQIMRQARLEREELGIRALPSENKASKHLLAYVQSPLDEMQVWHHNHNPNNPHSKLTDNVPGPVVLPLRYHHTLLFADDMGETHPNPSLSRAS